MRTHHEDWIQLNFNQNPNIRNLKFITIDNARFKIGQNKACYRLKIINNQTNLIDMNDSVNTFKIKMKKQFLD